MKTIRITVVLVFLTVAPAATLLGQSIATDQSDVLKLKIAREHKNFAMAKQNLVFRDLLSRGQMERNILAATVLFLASITVYLTRRISFYKIRTEVAAPAHSFQLPVAGETNSILSQREKQILKCLASGMSHKQIAAEYEISYHTVRYHVKNIYAKLKVKSLAEAVAEAMRQKFVE